MDPGVVIQDAGDGGDHGRSLVAFEEMLEFLVIRLSQASDALSPPGEEGELTSALHELTALMNGLAEELVMESPTHRHTLLRTSLLACLRAILGRTFAGEPDGTVISVQEALQSVARALAKVLPVADGTELEGVCESLMLLLDKRQAFYRHTGVPGGGVAPGVEGADLLAVMSEEEWRRGIGFADWVDAISSESTADVRRWRRAQIVEESSVGRLRLSFESLSDFHDEWVDRDSANIAPPGTRAGQEVGRWRQSLQPGSLVDALDPNNTWTNATVMDVRERLGAPVVLGVGAMGGSSTDKVLDLLISFRVYDPDGDREEPLLERHEAAGEAGQGATWALYASPAARREELDAMAAAAAQGGLAARPRRAAGVPPLEPLLAVGRRQDGAAEAGGAPVVGFPAAGGSGVDLPDVAVGGGADAVAAPAAGGWGLAGRSESSGGGSGSDSGSSRAGGRGQRYFGLSSRDEWITASSSRIEKLNSRAPWKNSWTEEAPVNDKDDPYLTEDGASLVFAVPRAPVDGSPCLVANINEFGQEGGFENLIVRLSPPAPEDTLPAPVADAPLPPAPPPSTSSPSTPSLGAGDPVLNPPQPPAPLSPPPPAQGQGQGQEQGQEQEQEQQKQREQQSRSVGESAEISPVTTVAATAWRGGEVESRKKRSAGLAVPLETLRHALVAVSSVRPLLARRVAKAILDRTATAVAAALKGASDSELRGLTRERLEGIMNGFREVLKRGHRSSEAFRRVERLKLDLALKLYSCPFMERKLQGLKVLADALTASETAVPMAAASVSQGNFPALTPQELVKWLEQKRFVKALFADHTQLIRRSGDVLGFLCRERALSAEYLDIIWAAGGGGQDKDRRICVHEVLRPLLYQLDMALLERLVDKLRLQPADEVIEDTVAFIRDMADATQQGGAAPAIRLLDLLWLMADDKSPYRPRIKATAAESILPVTGLRGLKGHRSLTLERCVNNVQEGRAVVTSLKVLEAVLQNYPRDATTFDALSRRDVIHSLEAERGLTELLLRELESYVASSRCSSSDHVEVRGAAHDGSSRPASPLPAPSKASVCTGTGGLRRGGGSATGEAHLAQVKARLHTLQHVHDNSRLVLSTEQVKRLWACLGPGPGLALPSSSPVAAAAVDSPSSEEGKSASITAGEGARATPGEISTLLSWLSKACEACEGGGGGGMFEPGVAAELFQDLILSDGERRDFAAKQVSPEWFSCFQTFFFTVNRQAGRMYPSPDAGHFPRPPPPTASTKASAGVSSSGTEDRDARRSMLPRDPDAPLDVVVMPSDLSGMRALWNVALEAEDVAVVDQATRLLNRTHQELAPDLQDHIGEIRKEFINTCMAYVKEGNASGDDVNNVGDDRDGVGSFNDRESTVRRQRSVVRALHLLEEFVDETEMGGTARLRGHGARVRGAKVLLKLDNKIPTPNQLPATFKLEMHSNSQVWEVRRSLALKGNMPVKDLELKVMRGASDGETGAGSRIADYGGGSELRSVEALDRSNSRRLGDLGLRSDDVWVMTVRTGPVVGRVPLLDGDGKLLSRPRAIFQRWFCDFQNADGLMDRVGAAKFIDSCCHDQCKPTDDRVKKFFRNYDSTGDGRMRQHDFLRLFQDSCKDMPEVVWSNLKAHHYRNDLTRPGVHDITATNVKDGTVVASDEDEEGLPLPRSIISRDALSIKSLLAVLSLGGPAAAAAWRFLMRLPTNPEMLDGVRRLQGFQSGGEHHVGESEPATEDCDNGGGGEGWKTLLGPPGSHRLLYTLQIVDGVLDSVIGDTVDRVDGGDRSEVGGKDTSPTLMPESSPEIEEMDCGRWVADFVRSGGFSQFCEAILTRGVFGDDRPERMVDAQQGCLALIIKVVRIVLLGVLSVSIPPSPEATRGSSRAAPTLGQAPTLEVEASVPSSAETAPAVEGEGGTSVHVDSADTTEVALPLSSSVQKDGVVAPGVGREEGEGVSSCGDSPLKGGGSGAGAVQQPSPEARDRIGDVDDGGDILSPPSVLKPGSREHAMPWACLPRDVLESVVQAVDVPELQARLMELAGTAADIADAAYHGVRSRRRWKAAQSDAIEIAPLNLFGWVGEGAPCDAMAEEALRLWGGVSRTPRGSCQPSALTERDGSDGQDQPAGAIQGHFRRGEGSTVIDVPILKAIFCVSDAIRRQLAHSLLSVCAGGGGALRCDALVGTTNVSTRRRDGVPLERGDSSLSTSVTTTASDAVSMADTNADTKDNDDDDDKGASRATKEMALPSTSCTPTTKASESDGLRDHVVRLLLDNIPRVAKPGKVSGAGQQQQQQCGEPGLAAGAGYAARPTDCTQLFDVLCVLVEGSIRAAAGEGQAGGASGVGSGDGAAVSGKESDRGRFDVDALAEMVVERLLAHPCTERRGAKDADKDTLLVGLLKLGLAIVDACPEAAIPVGEGLVEALLEDFLFAPPTPATTESESLAPTRPKCKTVASRAMAYKLLAALCKPRVSCRSPSSGVGSSRRRGDGDDAFDSSLPLRLVLQKGFTPLRKMLSKPDVWGYSPSSGERSSVGRVGLRNLGNTCYVNSCLQQLFTMEPLRNGLLSLSEGDTDPGSLVAELQKLFGHLTLSEKQAVDPLPFLRTVKDLDGNAIDVSVQQDAQGFLLDLFDKMEAGLKNTPQASLMSTFEGGQITQLICPKPRPSHAPAGEGGRSPTADATATGAATVAATLGGEQEPSTGGGVGGNDAQVQQGEGDSEGVEMRERGEAFMCVSLEVKNMVGVEDALEKFTEKEIIEGYAWDDERKDVSIHKRTVLGRLPPNVVLHLNRFKMNLDTFQTEKVNTRFDFPIKLDLEPFTKEGLAWRERVEAAGGRGPEDAKRLGLPGPYEVHPRSYYTYQLRGVVVHTGTANQGHYFSYIREDSKPTQNRPCSDVVGDSGIDVGGEVTHGAPTRPVQPSAVAEGAVSSPSTTTTSVSVDDTTGTGSSSNRSNSAVSEEMKEPPGTASGTAAGGSASTAWHDGFCVGGKFSMGMPPVDSAIARGVGAVDSDGQGQESHRWCEFNDTVVREWTLEGRRRGKTGVEQEGGREGERDGGGADSMSRIGGLETDCFGGQQTMQETDEYGWPRTLRKDNIQNAYLLFYERIDQSYGVEAQPEPVSPEREEGEERETHAGDGGNDGAKPTPLGALAPTTVAEFGSEDSSREAAEGTTVEAAAVGAIVSAATIPPGVFRAVWDDNNKFLLDRQLYHPDMSNFVLEIMKAVRQLAAPEADGHASRMSPDSLVAAAGPSVDVKHDCDGPASLEATGAVALVPKGAPSERGAERGYLPLVEGFLEWGVQYLLNNLARALDNEAFGPIVDQLQGLYDLRPDLAGAFLDAETEAGLPSMREMLLLCPDRPVRVAMRGFYLHLLGILAEGEGDRYLDYEEASLPQVEGSPSPSEPYSTSVSTSVSEAASLTPTSTPAQSGPAPPLEEDSVSGPPAAEEREEDKGRPATRLGRLVAGWVGLLPDAARSWGRFEQFLEFIEGVGNMGDRERDLLLSRRMVCRLSSFLLQEKSPVYDPQKRLPRMGHKTAPPRFAPLVRCLRSLRAHSGETSRWQPRGVIQVESDTDTASDSEGSRSDDSTRAVVALPVGPGMPLTTSTAAASLSMSPEDQEAREAAAAVEAVRRLEEASAAPAAAAESMIVDSTAEAVVRSVGSDGTVAAGTPTEGSGGGGAVPGGRSKMTAKERSRSVALSLGCRRCLNCETLYELAFEEQHAPEAAADLMCSWAADGSKLVRPLSRMIVQGIDSTPFADVDSWLLALRSWLEIDDTLQAERHELVLGTGKPEAEPKLLLLMVAQKDKYEKWLFRVLTVLSELMVENPAIGLYVSKLRGHEMLPWSDWMTKHLIDTYSTLRGAGPTRVNETDLVQIKENLGAYEKRYFGYTAEERLLDMARRAKMGPAEGETGMTRVESSTSNGVQVEMLDVADSVVMGVGMGTSSTGAGGVLPGGIAFKRFWRVTNHRMDSVNFTFKVDPTSVGRLDTVYPPRRPNFHVPLGCEIKRILQPRDCVVLMEVEKIDLTKEFQPHPFSWVFESITTPPPEAVSTAQQAAAVPAAPPPVVPAAAAVLPASPPSAMTMTMTPSDLLEQQAQLDGDLGEVARVALACEREEAAAEEAAAIAAAKADEELSEALAATAASLPVIPYEVVSKMKAETAAETKVGDVAAAAAAAAAAASAAQGRRQRQAESAETAAFWEAGRRNSALVELEARSNVDGEALLKEELLEVAGKGRGQEEENIEENDENDETVLFSHEDSSVHSMTNSEEGDETLQDGDSAGTGSRGRSAA